MSSTDNGMNNHNSNTATSPSSSTVGKGREEVVDLQRWVSVLQQVWSEVVYNDTDRRVSATGIVRLPLPHLSVRVRDFVVQLATPPHGSVVQGNALDLCLAVRRPAQPQSPSLTSSTSLASLLQRQGQLLGYDRGVEKLRVFVWMHEDFLITGRTNGHVEVIEALLQYEGSKEVQADSGAEEERRDVWRLRCVALRSGWASLPRIQLLWDRSGHLDNAIASHSSATNGGGGAQGAQCIFDLGEFDELRPKLFVLPNSASLITKVIPSVSLYFG
jgi:hypothetical protein